MNEIKKLIQKIRDDLAFKITGVKNIKPSKKQLSDYFTTVAKDKPYYWAYSLHSIMTLKVIEKVSYASIVDTDRNNDLQQAFDILIENQHDKCIASEIYYCPKPLPENNCVWIVKEVYDDTREFAILIADESIIREEYQTIILQKQGNNPIQIIYQVDKNQTSLDDENIISNLYIDLAIKTFLYFANNPTGKFIGLDWARKKGQLAIKYEPPLDAKLAQYLNELKNGYRQCIKARVNIDNVVPFSYAHAYEIPETYIFDTLEGIINLDDISILTYVDGDKYIMSDDYTPFLALKISDVKTITIVNLGDLINEEAEVITTGGIELLPPLIFKQFDFNSLPLEEQKKRFNNRLNAIKSIKKLKDFLLSDFLDIKNEIANDELGKAILQLKPFVSSDDTSNILTSINARLSKLRNDIQLGIVKYEDEELE
jgi:hypothetical protein